MIPFRRGVGGREGRACRGRNREGFASTSKVCKTKGIDFPRHVTGTLNEKTTMKIMLVLTTTLLSLAFLAGASVTLEPVPVSEPAVTNMPREVKLTIASFGMGAAATPTESLRRSLALGRDYLTSRLYRKGGAFITMIDSEDKACGNVEYRISVTLGNLERNSRTVQMGMGVEARQEVYSQPYVGKICNREGKVLFAFDGTAEWKERSTNMERVELPDPSRQLLETACEKIAAEVVAFYTNNLTPVHSDQ